MRIAYFVPEYRASSNRVLHSQVLGQAVSLQRAGFECLFIGSELDADSVSRALALWQFAELSGTHIFESYPKKPSTFSLMRTVRCVGRSSWQFLASWCPDVIYVRSLTSVRVAQRMAKRLGARFVFDVRGLSAEEFACKHGRIPLVGQLLAGWEIACIRRADQLLCVSHKMRSWINEHTGRTDVEVVPSCVDTDEFEYDSAARSDLRKKLGWSDDIPVIAYSGGMSQWQRIGDILELLVGVRRFLPELRVLLLTTLPSQMATLARESGLPDEAFEVRCAEHKDVPKWLSCADAGIILRHNIPLNNVASPVKIAEYLACGLPILCSEGIGDLSELIVAEHIGMVVPEDRALALRQVADFLHECPGNQELRKRVRNAAQAHLSWSAYIQTYRRVYSLPNSNLRVGTKEL